ncbi:fatty acid desaturase, partial [Qipengyuania citrea]
LFAASMGVWLFYIQHQFPQAYWESKSDWSFAQAALMGSTHLDLPPVLRWFTGNIGIHHVHHLSSTIPFHRLPEVLKAHPALRDLNRYTAWESLSAFRLALWDEEQQRMVTFAEAKKMTG